MSLTSYQLKYIALFTMIIDHTAVVFSSVLSREEYFIMRGIGRLAFPIFCFLLAEGFSYSHDRRKYFIRLLAFCAISEIPFKLAIHSASHNVFFTLAIGFAAMLFLEKYGRNQTYLIAGILLFPCIGELVHCDYGALGVITILLFYLAGKNASFPLSVCYLPLLISSLQTRIQVCCIASLIFLHFYNGEKGQGLKYLFYVAYPAHLLLLYILKIQLL